MLYLCTRLKYRTFLERENTVKMTTKKSGKSTKRNLLIVICVLVVVLALAVWYVFFHAMSKKGEQYVFIMQGDNIEDVYSKLRPVSNSASFAGFRLLAAVTGYSSNIRPGRYSVGTAGALMTFRNFKNGHQASVHLTVPSMHLLTDLSKVFAKKMQFSEKEFMSAVSDSLFLDSLGYTPRDIIGVFIPNTYDFYWNTSARDFVRKMVKNSQKFWTPERLQKAKADSLTPKQVVIIASMISEETNNDKEKPIIAGIYINRLRINMPLQSCPTVKYALKDFKLQRIYTWMTQIENPYNTYNRYGLPPGPIRNPNPEDIDAVLNFVHHDYLYMCASAKFDGTHHFSKTYEEQKAYSKEYDAELNKRNIK